MNAKKKNKQKGKQEKKLQKKPNFVDRALVDEENQLKISLTVIYNKFLKIYEQLIVTLQL